MAPQGKRRLAQFLAVLMDEQGGAGLSQRMILLISDARAQWAELARHRATGSWPGPDRQRTGKARTCRLAGRRALRVVAPRSADHEQAAQGARVSVLIKGVLAAICDWL